MTGSAADVRISFVFTLIWSDVAALFVKYKLKALLRCSLGVVSFMKGLVSLFSNVCATTVAACSESMAKQFFRTEMLLKSTSSTGEQMPGCCVTSSSTGNTNDKSRKLFRFVLWLFIKKRLLLFAFAFVFLLLLLLVLALVFALISLVLLFKVFLLKFKLAFLLAFSFESTLAVFMHTNAV